MRIIVAALFLCFCAVGIAQEPAPGAGRERAVAVERLLRERPRDPTLWFYLARFDAQAGDVKGCVAALERVAELGEGFLPARELGFAKAWDDPAFQAVRARLEARLPRLDFAPTAFELEDRRMLPEGIAYDAHSASFFMGSLTEHRILRLGAGGDSAEFAGSAARLDAVVGLAVDGPRRKLYAVSTSALGEAAAAPHRNAIVAFDVDSGRLLRRVDVAQATQLNDVTVAPGGRVYATDSGSGAVYEIPEKGEPSVVLAAGQLGGSNGIAPSPDGRLLYVAHSSGLAVIDLASGRMKRVAIPPRETVAAIDGLYQWQGSLIGVQNATTPGRVILMTLARDGESVTRVQTLLSHHHSALDEPTTGAVTPDGFFLLAATGVTHLRADGTIERPETLHRPTVLRIPLPR